MNIFKTIASGSGSINEQHVSAFLGYLLNPKEDHGLGDAFLRKFLESLVSTSEQLKYLKGRSLSIHSNFEIEVLLEQAFKESNKGDEKGDIQIVDIVILCYEKGSQSGRYLADDIIIQRQEGGGNLKHIILIENKIKDSSTTSEQLKKQFERTIIRLKELKIDTPENLVSVIYVTPGEKKSIKEFESFKETNSKKHLYWNVKDKNEDNASISQIISDILKKEAQPLNNYCEYTLRAFLEFIKNDFKSTITEELEKKKESQRFIYKQKEYNRARLAEEIIRDYVSDYEKENKKKISYQELSDLFPGKMDKIYPPFLEKNEAQKFNSSRSADWYYKTNPIEIEDRFICVRNDWYNDKELQYLLDITVSLKLDDIRADISRKQIINVC